MDIDREGHGSGVPRQSQSAEGPPRTRREEVAVRGTDVAGGRCTASTAQHVLADHELAVVLAHRTRCGPEARVRRIGARSPFPGVTEDPIGRERGPRMWGTR